MVRPMIFGYMLVKVTAPTPTSLSDRRSIARFADREGFAVGQVFVEAWEAGPRVALDSLIEATVCNEVAAVVIPDWTHLGADPDTQQAVRLRVEINTGVPVISISRRS